MELIPMKTMTLVSLTQLAKQRKTLHLLMQVGLTDFLGNLFRQEEEEADYVGQ